MTEIARLSRSTAKQNPSEAFESPAALAAEVMLTRGEKIGALERWRRDVLLELTASGEGMLSDVRTGRPAILLSEIEIAIRELTEVDHALPAK